MDILENQQKIETLLVEFDTHRDNVKAMIDQLETIRNHIDDLIPTSLDHRYIRYFEEKVKSITALFNVLLEMRKEIIKSVKDEIEIRRKIEKADDDADVEDMIDVRKLAEKIDDFKSTKDKLQEARLKLAEKKDIDKSIKIPGLNDVKETG